MRYFVVLFLAIGVRADLRPQERLSRSPIEYLAKGYDTAPWIIDPFFGVPNYFRVTALISGKMAFINDQWVKVGEYLGGYRVESVLTDRVILEMNSHRKTLVMP